MEESHKVSCLSPLLFNLYVSDLKEGNLYVDDIGIVLESNSIPNLRRKIKRFLENLFQWADKKALTFNVEKLCVVPCIPDVNLSIEFWDATRKHVSKIESKTQVKYLGITLTQPNGCGYKGFSLERHTSDLIEDCYRRIPFLRRMSNLDNMPVKKCLDVYIAVIRAKIDYSLPFLSASEVERVQKIQNSALRIILGAFKSTPIAVLHGESGLPSLKYHKYEIAARLFSSMQSVKNEAGNNFDEWLKNSSTSAEVTPYGTLHDILPDLPHGVSPQRSPLWT